MNYNLDWNALQLEKAPLYRPNAYPERLDSITFDDEIEKVWGRRWGARSKIGKIHTVLCSRPGRAEINQVTKQDPKYFLYCGKYGIPGFGDAESDDDLPNLKLMAEQHEAYTDTLKRNGVEIIFADFPDKMDGAYLPYRGAGYPPPLMIGNGCIIGRSALAWKRGQEAIWTKKVAEIGLPIIYTVHGSGIFEGRMDWLDPYHILLNVGHRGNMEGFRQVETILKMNGVRHVVPVFLPEYVLTHLDCVFSMVAANLAVTYRKVMPYETLKQLEAWNIELINVPDDEVGTGIINCFPLEPGRIIAPRGAKKTVHELERHGVEVIEVNVSESLKLGAGPDCMTLALIRDDGPLLSY